MADIARYEGRKGPRSEARKRSEQRRVPRGSRPRHLNSKLLHPVVDRRAFHSQTYGRTVGPCHHPIRLFKSPQYLRPFRFL